MGIVRDVEVCGKSGTFVPKVIEEGIDLSDSGSQAELGACSKECTVKADITALQEGEKSVDFLVRRDMVNEGDKCIPHGHMVGIGISDKAYRRLGVNGMV